MTSTPLISDLANSCQTLPVHTKIRKPLKLYHCFDSSSLQTFTPVLCHRDTCTRLSLPTLSAATQFPPHQPPSSCSAAAPHPAHEAPTLAPWLPGLLSCSPTYAFPVLQPTLRTTPFGSSQDKYVLSMPEQNIAFLFMEEMNLLW